MTGLEYADWFGKMLKEAADNIKWEDKPCPVCHKLVPKGMMDIHACTVQNRATENMGRPNTD